MCRSSSPGRGNFFLLRADPRASAEKGVVVFTGHGQNDAGGHFHHETNERYLLQKLRLFRVTAFFIADVGNGLILSCSSEFESSVCSHTPCRYDRVFSVPTVAGIVPILPRVSAPMNAHPWRSRWCRSLRRSDRQGAWSKDKRHLWTRKHCICPIARGRSRH
jgi:hypothetical protein